jgi:hypothetical protein
MKEETEQVASNYVTKSPVLFLIFNRPDTTRQVFEAIRAAKPSKLYIAADGPRPDRTGEAARCEEARQIATAVDWDCEVETFFQEGNLGCKWGPLNGLNWFFRAEPEGIVLEDDCLPSQSFFHFCDEMLKRYRHDNRVFLVSGYNRQQEWKRHQEDYFFSNYGGIWGWASWRRAWDTNDPAMKRFDSVMKKKLLQDLLGANEGRRRGLTIHHILQNNVDAWDYQWGFARHINNGLACVPRVNLVENIGFGEDATHTTSSQTKSVKSQDLSFPLKHNSIMIPDRHYDALFHPHPGIFKRIVEKLKRLSGIGKP